MQLLRQPYIAIRSYVDAVVLIFTTYLWLVFLVPLCLSIGMYYGGEVLMDNFRTLDLSELKAENGSEFLLVGLQGLGIYLMYHMNRYVVLGIMTPILMPLSTKAEYHLTGNRYPLIFSYYIDDLFRALRIILRNVLLQMLWMGLIYSVCYFYGLPAWVDRVGYYLVAFYFYGFSFMDYANERRRLTLPEAVQFTRKHFLVAFVLGGLYGGMFYIPYAGPVIAPILAVVAGTVAVHRIVDLSTNPYAQRDGEEAAESRGDEAKMEEGEEVVT